ncbi:hypothetical protein [Cognatishimia sp. MH4019]|uniref:hypothetical protein n=1 Tax=Cognatishimia sp. MH4019 TaxID=2854030 RepID=UPI001CD7372A|nr:hypothetical protein [Cognatishimia sp. MH4019]
MRIKARVLKDYLNDPALFGPFENHVLYAMTHKHLLHDGCFVTMGKIMAIGRIYAADPFRHAPRPHSHRRKALYEGLAHALKDKGLDKMLADIGPLETLTTEADVQIDSDMLFQRITQCHAELVKIICSVKHDWALTGGAPETTALWKFAHAQNISFASKYLHFHRPNAFPIYDSIARHGLRAWTSTAAGATCRSTASYPAFCKQILKFAAAQSDPRTLRELDTMLLDLGKT